METDAICSYNETSKHRGALAADKAAYAQEANAFAVLPPSGGTNTGGRCICQSLLPMVTSPRPFLFPTATMKSFVTATEPHPAS